MKFNNIYYPVAPLERKNSSSPRSSASETSVSHTALCIFFRVCTGCVGLRVSVCVQCVHRTRLSLIAQVHLLILETWPLSNRHKRYRQKHTSTDNTHTRAHATSACLKASTWTLDNLHPFYGSCVDRIDWHGLQYGPYCLWIKASQHKAKVTL